MSRSYMSLDERPEPPKKEKAVFDDRRKYYGHYPSMKHESDLRKVSLICIIVVLLGLALVTMSTLSYFGIFTIDLSFMSTNDIGKWINDNFGIICIVTAVLSVLIMFSACVAADSGFTQEHYRRGLAAYVVLILSSVWTIIIPIISIISLIYYMKAKGSFFN